MTFGGPPPGPNPYRDPSQLRAFSPGEPTLAPEGGTNGTVRSVAFGLGATVLTLTTITAVLLPTDPGRASGGAEGPATDTGEASRALAVDLLLANMSRSEGDRLDVTGTEPFSNEHGVAGHITTTTLTARQGDPDARCPVRDGVAIGISYLSPAHDLVGWALMAETGYEDELPDETIGQMVGSIRYYNAG
ncbi:hypothetical protein ACWGIB_28340 [Streptomyces xiamenensis]